MKKSRPGQTKPSLRYTLNQTLAWIRSRALRSALPCLVFLGFLALYTATLSPDVLPADSGEFQKVASTAGVAHPPGYPLYTMLGWLFARLPLGPTPAWRVTFFSAITTAATVTLLFCAVRHLTSSPLAGMTASIALGSSTTIWATATTASIRPLTAFFTSLCLYALIKHRSHLCEAKGGPRDRYVVLFSISLSLGLTHHPSLLFPGAISVAYLLLADPDLLHQPQRWIKPLLALLPGLLVWIYLPLRGGSRMRTLSGFLDHILARGFRGDMFALSLLDRLVLLPTLLRFQFNPVLLIAACLGALLLLWEDRRMAFLFVGSFLLHTAITLTYDAPQTVEYAIPAYVSLGLLAGVPPWLLFRRLSSLLESRPPDSSFETAGQVILHAAGVVLLLAGVANLRAHLPSYRELSQSHTTRDYVAPLLDHAPPRAVILCNWHWFTPLQYVQQIEGTRPDVTVEYVAPEGEPLAETWVRTIEKYSAQRPVIVVRFFEQEYARLPYVFEPFGEAFLVRSQPRREIPSDMASLDTVLGGRINLLGYRLSRSTARVGEPLIVELAWSPRDTLDGEIALFAQLIDDQGQLASAAEDPRHALDSLSPGEIVIDRFTVHSRVHTDPGEYGLTVGAYDAEGRLTTGDGSDGVMLQTVELEPSLTRPATQHPLFVRFAGGPTLIGLDYDLGMEGMVRTYLHWTGPGDATRVELLQDSETPIAESGVPPLRDGEYATLALDTSAIPRRLSVVDGGGTRRWNGVFRGPIRLPSAHPEDRYVPFGDALVLTSLTGPPDGLDQGTEVTLRLRLRGQRPLQRDYIVSTSLTGLREDGTWAWRASHDAVPALGAIPTLKWIRGSLVVDPHRIAIPDDAADVATVGTTVVYDHFTQRRLPHLDERFGPVVEIGSWPVRP